eukprot:g4148.t1
MKKAVKSIPPPNEVLPQNSNQGITTSASSILNVSSANSNKDSDRCTNRSTISIERQQHNINVTMKEDEQNIPEIPETKSQMFPPIPSPNQARRPMTVEFYSISHVHTRTEVRKAVKTIVTTFEDGPLGIELCQMKNGGVMVKDIKPGGLAEVNGTLRKAMQMLKIDGEDVSKKKVSEVIAILKRTMRPVYIEWKTAPSRKMNQEKYKFERTGNINLVIIYGESGLDRKPLGIELVQRKRGGAMVKSIKPQGLAFTRGGLRKSMNLLEINDEDVSHLDLKDVISKLKNAAWPLKTVWKSAPSRSISPHARWHSRQTAMKKVQNENIELMRRSEVQQKMVEEEMYKREYDLVYMKFQNLKPLIEDGSLTREEAVAMAHKKGNESEESEAEKEENKVERYSEENVEAAIKLIQTKVLKGKPLPEDEESLNKIKDGKYILSIIMLTHELHTDILYMFITNFFKLTFKNLMFINVLNLTQYSK